MVADEFASDGEKRESKWDRIRKSSPKPADNAFVHKLITADTEVFTPEVLKAQDGRKVPLTIENGGPVIGEVTLHYVEETGNLEARFRIDDPVLAEFFQGPISLYSIEKES